MRASARLQDREPCDDRRGQVATGPEAKPRSMPSGIAADREFRRQLRAGPASVSPGRAPVPRQVEGATTRRFLRPAAASRSYRRASRGAQCSKQHRRPVAEGGCSGPGRAGRRRIRGGVGVHHPMLSAGGGEDHRPDRRRRIGKDGGRSRVRLRARPAGVAQGGGDDMARRWIWSWVRSVETRDAAGTRAQEVAGARPRCCWRSRPPPPARRARSRSTPRSSPTRNATCRRPIASSRHRRDRQRSRAVHNLGVMLLNGEGGAAQRPP